MISAKDAAALTNANATGKLADVLDVIYSAIRKAATEGERTVTVRFSNSLYGKVHGCLMSKDYQITHLVDGGYMVSWQKFVSETEPSSPSINVLSAKNAAALTDATRDTDNGINSFCKILQEQIVAAAKKGASYLMLKIPTELYPQIYQGMCTDGEYRFAAATSKEYDYIIRWSHLVTKDMPDYSESTDVKATIESAKVFNALDADYAAAGKHWMAFTGVKCPDCSHKGNVRLDTRYWECGNCHSKFEHIHGRRSMGDTQIEFPRRSLWDIPDFGPSWKEFSSWTQSRGLQNHLYQHFTNTCTAFIV